MESVLAFNARHGAATVVDTVELKASSPDKIERAVAAVPPGIEAYVEIPVVDDPRPLVYAIARAGARAKVRTGGVTADAFPEAADLTRFLQACLKADVAFKATAGLHHALRAEYPLTYAAGSESAPMFGFLNVFLAAALLLGGASVADAHALLEERDAAALRFDDGGVTWAGHRLGIAQLDAARERAVSFGSCSFREPIEELHALNLLPATS
jgi:hypothetical protein